MVSANDLLHEDLLKRVEGILQSNSVHRASISFRTIKTNTCPSTETHRSITFNSPPSGGHPAYTRSDTEELFHVASITKILVAIAVVHAIATKADEDQIWARFKGISRRPITEVINQYTGDDSQKLGDLPGEPSIYDLMIHSKSLEPINDLMLAPDGTPMWTLQHLRQEHLPPFSSHIGPNEDRSRWTEYSNTNYAVIALAIETLWGGHLDDFMVETLFIPLGMKSTSIGYPSNRQRPSSRWTVDEHGFRRQVQTVEYEANGAEAGALGAYSTARDLDTLFSCIINADSGGEHKEFAKTADALFRPVNKSGEEFRYTPLGLYAPLSSSVIGCLSLNRLQFPDEPFNTYLVIPSESTRAYPVHYMAGSAVGCCCATALHVDESDDFEDHFALVVLTDTSGPVDAADHILRLILREYVTLRQPRPYKTFSSLASKSVEDWASESRTHAIENWKATMGHDEKLERISLQVPLRLDGIFAGVGFSQQLKIEKRGGYHQLKVIGPLVSPLTNKPNESAVFKLFWIDQQSFKLHVPMHMSIDRLDNGEWSELIFKVVCEGDRVEELIRDHGSGARHYKRE